MWQLSLSLLAQSAGAPQANESQALLESYRHVEVASVSDALEQLTGRKARTLNETLDAIGALRALGPRVALVTSLLAEDTPADAVDLVACDAVSRHRTRTPKLPVAAHGAGDLIAAAKAAFLIASPASTTGKGTDAISITSLQTPARRFSRSAISVAACALARPLRLVPRITGMFK